MTADAPELAMRIWAVVRAEQQCAALVDDDALAEEVRRRIRRLARADGIAVRTARLEDTVVVVRLDADIWEDDAATMRSKLSPDRASGEEPPGRPASGPQ